MSEIRVKRGSCGIRYTDAAGTVRFKTISAADGRVECEDKQAERLVRLGVAEYCSAKESAAEQEKAPETENSGQEQEKPDAQQLRKMTVTELEELAAERGLDTSGCRKKEDYVMLITSDEGAEVSDEDNDLPDLGAADPV